MPVEPSDAVKTPDKTVKEVPDIVCDKSRGINYVRGKFLGRGGFARCFELTNSVTKELVAGKIVSKNSLMKPHQREKMMQEVKIHKDLVHLHVVKLYTSFEDTDNIYITLELCTRRSLLELQKRRRTVTETEARYFTHHICHALEYLHGKKVIHRDLKLGNLFLNDHLQVKIGDFGLAAKIERGERKNTLCGTPNYIAPEILNRKGHSYEVDIWAVGCILYILLFGTPPFETQSLKSTYERIKRNQYTIPPSATRTVENLIKSLLAPEPSKRPNIKEALNHLFFNGFIPTRLPLSCLTMAPKFTGDDMQNMGSPGRNDVGRINMGDHRGVLSPRQIVRQDMMAGARNLNAVSENGPMDTKDSAADKDRDWYLPDLQQQLQRLQDSKPIEKVLNSIEDVAPEATPIYWISKWVDYSDKYGVGYQLSDNSVGVLFNDDSKLNLDEAGQEMTYIDKFGLEAYYQIDKYPDTLNKKVTLLKYFRLYMNEHLVRSGANVTKKDGDDLARLPVLRHWFRTRSGIILHLSNGTLQINFFDDHTKIILCPLMGAATYIDELKNFHVYRFTDLEKYGCSRVLMNRLKFGKLMVDRMLSNMDSRRGTAESVKAVLGSSDRCSARV